MAGILATVPLCNTALNENKGAKKGRIQVSRRPTKLSRPRNSLNRRPVVNHPLPSALSTHSMIHVSLFLDTPVHDFS